jgi:hypothetical protein
MNCCDGTSSGDMLFSTKRVVRLIILINVSQGIPVVLLGWNVVGLSKFVLISECNLWRQGQHLVERFDVIMLRRAIVREFVICGLVLCNAGGRCVGLVRFINGYHFEAPKQMRTFGRSR